MAVHGVRRRMVFIVDVASSRRWYFNGVFGNGVAVAMVLSVAVAANGFFKCRGGGDKMVCRWRPCFFLTGCRGGDGSVLFIIDKAIF